MSDTYQFEEEEFTTEFNGGTFLRILSRLRPHWRSTLGFIVAIAIVAVIEAVLTFVTKLMIDEGIIAQDGTRLLELITIYALLTALLSFGVFVFIFITGRLGQQVQYELRKEQFNHLQNLELSYYNKTPVGWIMSRVTSDSERIAELVSWGILDIVWAVMNVSTALFFMLTINWQLTLIVVPLVPVLVFIATWFKKRILVEFRRSRKFNSQITGNYNEMITGVRVIKAINREESSLKEFGELTRSMYGASYKAAWYSALFLPAVQITSAIVIGGIIVFGGLQIEQGALAAGITIGGIHAFIRYITFMMWPVQDLARVYASMQNAIASAERSFSLLDTEAGIVNRDNATDPGTIIGDIEFENVTFYYEENKDVLEDFSLTIKQGETIALVGHTGSGKSTIVNLLCRFYEPVEGVIRYNGIDYQDMTLHSLHSRIGMVLQTPHLFSGDIRENIRYGRLEATDAEVIEAAKIAGAHDFITELENGYKEEVGEGRSLLSVGQKQLISLARAILAQPELFIMD
ncbi:MAG: ABC transporter ATP-binding protein, partial [Aggregatilineales bacterium]